MELVSTLGMSFECELVFQTDFETWEGFET